MLKIFSVFLLVLIACEIQAITKRTYAKQEVLSPQIVESVMGKAATLKESHAYRNANLLACFYSAGTKRLPQDILFLWHQTAQGFELVYKRESSPGETFEKPILFTANNFSFLNISTEPGGSGGFVFDMMLWLAPDGTVHEVDFQQASEVYEGLAADDQVVVTGGEKEFFYQNDQMKFQFWIAQEGDPHCCPSGGAVTGTYKLLGSPKYDSFTRKYVTDFKILVDHLQHAPGSADASASP